MEHTTMQDFADWKVAVRCRKVEKKFEELAVEAIKNKKSVDEQMKANGFKNLTEFFMSCPTFSKYCWPSEFAELGSGYVLYFHFLAFVGTFMFLCFFVQLPAVMDYYGADNIEEWSSKWDKDFALNHFDPKKNFTSISTSYGTPGNMGPNKGDNALIPMLYFAMVCFLSVAVIGMSAFQMFIDHQVDAGTTHPNDFAILVEDLPRTATDETQIMQWFSEHAVEGQKDTEIVKVVIGWDNKEFNGLMRRMIQLKKLVAADPTAEEVPTYKAEMQKLNADLMSTAPDTAAKLASSGVAVVIFRNQTDHRKCLQRWTSLWAKWAYRDAGGCGGLMGGGSLPRFPIGDPPRPVYKIRVKRAPNPGDINWVDLGVTSNERWKKLSKTNGIMILIILISFGICYAMNYIKMTVDNAWLGLLPAFGIAFANVAVQQAAKKFGEKEFHNTVAGQTSSQSLKMTVGMIICTAGVSFAATPAAWMWFVQAGLVSDIIMLLSITAVIQPLLQYFDMKYTIKKMLVGGKLNDAKIAQWNAVADEWQKTVSSGGKPTADLVAKVRQARQEKDFFLDIHAPAEIDFLRRYAYAVRTFVCCMYYTPLVPILTLIGIIGIATQYWVDKALVTKWCRRPAYPQGPQQAKEALLFIRWASLLMPLAMWIFLHPCLDKDSGLTFWTGFAYVPALFLSLVPLSILRQFFCAPCRNRYKNRKVAADDHQEDYYQAQYAWTKEMKYHKSHFLYKRLPEAKNPENLTPGSSSALKADVMKDTIASDASGVADGAGGDGHAISLGHKVHGTVGSSSAGGDGGPTYGATATAAGASGGYGATPAYGAAAAPAAAPAATPAAAPAAVTPAVTPVMAPAADAGVTVVTPVVLPADDDAGKDDDGKSGPTWEYEQHKDDWRRFDDDCHDYIEKKYQEYKKSGDHKDKRAKVRTQGVTLSLDFERMSQMVEGGHGVKDIRRRD